MIDLFAKLETYSDTVKILDDFIQENSIYLIDFLSTQDYRNSASYKESFRSLIREKHIIIRQLDFSKDYNFSFIELMLRYAEVMHLICEFKILFNCIGSYKDSLNRCINAAALYILGTRINEQFNSILPQFLSELHNAYYKDEGNDRLVIHVFLNYYRTIVNNNEFNLDFVLKIRSKLLFIIASGKYEFLDLDVVKKTLAIDVADFRSANDNIITLIDEFLNLKLALIDFPNHEFVIEDSTPYSEELRSVPANFDSIREISSTRYIQVPNKDFIFSSLNRGVKILDQEAQLYSYMHGLGKMHRWKLSTAFEQLPDELIKKKIDIYDWGCGQGLGAMVLLEFFRAKDVNVRVDNVVLIEPSEIALRRACLHISKFECVNKITTIQNVLDKIDKDIIVKNSENTTIHIFSNILDIESFSLTEYTEKIKNSISGENYFICVSPFISIPKRERITQFVKSFDRYASFRKLYSVANRKHEADCRWSRIIEVFSVNINGHS